MTAAPNGLIHAKLLDGNGGAGDVDWGEAMAWSPEQGCLWLHFDYEEESTQHWITEASGLVASRAHAGVFWTHNDSGDAARLFAIGPGGSNEGEISLQDADGETMPGAGAVITTESLNCGHD